MKFKIGLKFKRRRARRDKRNYVETIVDIHTTKNLAGEVVKERYVATHDFLGQVVTDYDVIPTTIAIAEKIN